jgi:hypothetical protein
MVQFCSHLPVASRHTFFYSARLIRNSLSGFRLFSFEDISILSPCGPVFSYPSSSTSISHVIFIPPHRATPFSGLCGPQLLAIRSPHWHYSHQSDGFMAASYTAISGTATIVYVGLHPQPIINVCAVPCFLDVLPCAYRLHLRRVCACFAWTLTAYRRFVSHT